MTDSTPISAAGADGIRPQRDVANTRATDGKVAGAAFKALLESLEQRAEQLSQKSSAELSREGLADAVGDARASLDEMLSLKDRVLEEWRAAEQRSRAKQ